MNRWQEQRRRFGEPRWTAARGIGVTTGGWDGRVRPGSARRGPPVEGRQEKVDLSEILPPAREERRARSLSLLLALLLHLAILSLSFSPSIVDPAREPEPSRGVRVGRWKPPPPPATVRQPRTVVTEAVEARKIPVPDPAPDDPEPVPEPPTSTEVDLRPDVAVVLGTPMPPPGGAGTILAASRDGVIAPVLIPSSKVTPAYPDAARRAQVMGNVIVEIVVRDDGTVGDAVVLRTPGEGLGFEEAALTAVTQWRFQPGMLAGRPVHVRYTIAVEFVVR